MNIQNITIELLKSSVLSIQLFILTLIFSIPLGFIVAKGRMSKFKLISKPVDLYMLVMRGTPLMLQLLVVYYLPTIGLSKLGFNFQGLDRFPASVIAFSINYAAYFGEIFRGGIESIPFGQYEAGKVLGFSKTQTFFKIILPQVVKRVLPASANETITLTKDTALASVLGVVELFSLSKKFTSTYSTLVPLFMAGVFYFIMNWIVSKAFSITEKKLSYYR